MRTRNNNTKMSSSGQIKLKFRKYMNGGAQQGQSVNIYDMVDDLIELGKRENMRCRRGRHRFENKFNKIMDDIPYATDQDDLKECFIEIHHVMFKPNRNGIIPIDLYHKSLRSKLQVIENEICRKIDVQNIIMMIQKVLLLVVKVKREKRKKREKPKYLSRKVRNEQHENANKYRLDSIIFVTRNSIKD